MLGFITMMDWWKYAGHREVCGIRFPFPRRLTFLSGICMATIMGTTTLVFSIKGISIVLVLVLLRGGILIVAPLVDAIVGRRVRWFSWAAMLTSLLAVLVVLGDAANYKLSLAAIIIICAYLGAYFIKLQLMSRLAKTDDKEATLRYFVEEQMVASPLLLIVLVVIAALGSGDFMLGFRTGLTTFLLSPEAILALLVGLSYAGLCICTTLIFLDRRENTFCVPMHCGSSMLAGLVASYALSLAFHQTSPSELQLISAGLIVVAITVLSPLHHFERFLRKVDAAFTRMLPGSLPTPGKPDMLSPLSAKFQLTRKEAEVLDGLDELRRAFLFVCSGNTCRSPIAAAIGNAEIAARLPMSAAVVDGARPAALSAGISAKVGAPMTAEAQQALRSLGVPVLSHSARNLTPELAHQVDTIFCMTQAHRNALIDLVPGAAAKTRCLDPDGDVDDPMGKSFADYVNCAQRIQSLVRLRFDELGLVAAVQ
jgi:protein-tyrosine-phosphatase